MLPLEQFRCQCAAWYESCSVGRVPVPRFGALFCVFALLGCSGESVDSAGMTDDQGPPDPPASSVELGVPSGDDGLDFTPLEDGTVLNLQTFGQGGTHVYLGVRCVGFGKRAYIGFSLTNLTNGREVVAPPPARPQLLYCHEDDPNVCDLVPVTVMTGGLTDPDEDRDGLGVRLSVNASNDAGVTGDAAREIVLSTADLLPLP